MSNTNTNRSPLRKTLETLEHIKELQVNPETAENFDAFHLGGPVYTAKEFKNIQTAKQLVQHEKLGQLRSFLLTKLKELKSLARFTNWYKSSPRNQLNLSLYYDMVNEMTDKRTYDWAILNLKELIGLNNSRTGSSYANTEPIYGSMTIEQIKREIADAIKIPIFDTSGGGRRHTRIRFTKRRRQTRKQTHRR